jgi:putative membrane protein
VVVPHQRTQSMAMHQGPLARRFKLADLVLHTTAGPVTPRVIQADVGEALALFDAQAARARAARKRQTSEHWLAQVAPLVEPAPPAEHGATTAGFPVRAGEVRERLGSETGLAPELDHRASNPTQQEGPQRG